MKIHEYQAKALFREYGIPTPQGDVAETAPSAKILAQKFAGQKIVVKAQIHAGGRGKGGGVRVVDTPEQAEQAASEIIGMQLVTHQTGPEGKKVKCVLVEEGSEIAQELYLSIILDRAVSQPVLMASAAGGMDIEEVASKTPEKIIKEWIDPLVGIFPYQARKVAYALNLPEPCIKEAVSLILNLYRLFWEQDCSLVEVNPLIITKDQHVLALDGKINFDDNALYRHPNLKPLRDLDEEDSLEVEASRYNLNYIKLDGNVGCMVNGAGLAMATMDIIQLYGASPANFLDVGGGANAEAIENAFRILLSDKNVKAVLINIFGGILRCDLLAEGVVAAASKLDVKLPIVIRMEGTNVEQGKATLAQSGLKFLVADTMKDAAEKVAQAVSPVGATS